MASNPALESTSWTHVLDDALSPAGVHQMQSSTRWLPVGPCLRRSESSVNTREMRQDGCDVTAQHDYDRSLEYASLDSLRGWGWGVPSPQNGQELLLMVGGLKKRAWEYGTP